MEENEEFEESTNMKDSNSSATSKLPNEIQKLLEKKHSLEAKLINLEKQIYALETSYLLDTKQIGNIVTGWDNYLSARGGALKKPTKLKDSDRLFSLSSVTSFKNNDLPLKLQKISNNDNSFHNSSNNYSNDLLSDDETNSKGRFYKSRKAGPGRPRKVRAVEDDGDFIDM